MLCMVDRYVCEIIISSFRMHIVEKSGNAVNAFLEIRTRADDLTIYEKSTARHKPES